MARKEEWHRIIGNDPPNDDRLALEVWNKDNLVCMVRSENTGQTITWFKTQDDIVIPFNWFYEVMQEAKRRI